jgi:hypothetical protein
MYQRKEALADAEGREEIRCEGLSGMLDEAVLLKRRGEVKRRPGGYREPMV